MNCRAWWVFATLFIGCANDDLVGFCAGEVVAEDPCTLNCDSSFDDPEAVGLEICDKFYHGRSECRALGGEFSVIDDFEPFGVYCSEVGFTEACPGINAMVRPGDPCPSEPFEDSDETGQ